MPTYTPLQSIQLTSTSSSVTFSGIPQIYQDLVIVSNGITTTSSPDIYLRFNGDTASNYSRLYIAGTGSATAAGREVTATQIVVGSYNTTNSSIRVNVQNYSNSTTLKTTLSRNDSTVAANGAVGLWRSTAAITSVTLLPQSGNFDVGCTFDLYGISPVAAQNASASGGTDIFYDSTYVYHVFRGSGTFTPYRALTADILSIAGGGGGGYSTGGGGGAGGLLAFTSQSLTASTNYTVLVGSGGSGSSVNTSTGSNGSNSQFGSLTACVGGGGGGSGSNQNGQDGGSGGGGGGDSGGGGSGGGITSGQGGYGGLGSSTGSGRGGGGGGAGGNGGNASQGGGGGAATNAYSSWATATSTGVNGYYAGGGGGARNNAQGGDGGGGGGGNGGGTATQSPGTTNTGSGGGGNPVSGTGSTVKGANGGSGLVIVRYAR